MKIILSLLFFFLVLYSLGQTVSIKEYNYTSNSFGVVNSPRSVTPGDTLTFEITIIEDLKNDFAISPYNNLGTDEYRGLEIATPNNNPAIPIIDSCRELKYRIDFLADSNIVAVHDSSLTNPGASGSYSLTGYFEVDDQDSIDEITFKYVHVAIPCELEPGSPDRADLQSVRDAQNKYYRYPAISFAELFAYQRFGCNPCALSKNQTIPTFNLKKQKEFNIC
jgi:hypothetical protein